MIWLAWVLTGTLICALVLCLVFLALQRDLLKWGAEYRDILERQVENDKELIASDKKVIEAQDELIKHYRKWKETLE